MLSFLRPSGKNSIILIFIMFVPKLFSRLTPRSCNSLRPPHPPPNPSDVCGYFRALACQDPRTEDAPRRHGLTVLERWDYTFLEGRKPHIATLVCALLPPQGPAESGPSAAPARVAGHMLLRHAGGQITEEHQAFKSFMVASEGF